MPLKNDNSHSAVINDVCELISRGNVRSASALINEKYPFSPVAKSGRNYTPRVMTKVFVRDGFIDRYRGTRLIFPPTLRLISHYFPVEFPFHKNGKLTEGHIAYWELFPTIDHIIPVARGGMDSEENRVCCSMLTNSIKSTWTLEELQWELLPPGQYDKWDGMKKWFLKQVTKDPTVLEDKYIKRWYAAAREIETFNVK